MRGSNGFGLSSIALASEMDLVVSSLADEDTGTFGSDCVRLGSVVDLTFNVLMLISVNSWSSPNMFSFETRKKYLK